jgi:hypothetical protein
MAKDHIEDLAAFCRNRIDSMYGEIARKFGRKGPVYFVEKTGITQILNPLIWDLYPRAQDVYLVRDFRDLFCSILAYNTKRGYNSFGREQVENDLQFVQNLGSQASALLHCWKRRSNNGYLLRYEELIKSPRTTLEALLEHLSLDSSPATIEHMIQQASTTRDKVQKEHQTSPGPQASIGRWRREIPPALQQECRKVLDPFLTEFGYSLD